MAAILMGCGCGGRRAAARVAALPAPVSATWAVLWPGGALTPFASQADADAYVAGHEARDRLRVVAPGEPL